MSVSIEVPYGNVQKEGFPVEIKGQITNRDGYVVNVIGTDVGKERIEIGNDLESVSKEKVEIILPTVEAVK